MQKAKFLNTIDSQIFQLTERIVQSGGNEFDHKIIIAK